MKREAQSLMMDSLNCAITDPINNLKVGSTVTFGNTVRTIALDMSKHEKAPEFIRLSESLTLNIFSIMNEPKNLLTEKNIQIVFSKMHKMTLKTEEKEKWVTVLGEQVKTAQFGSLFQFVCMQIVERIMSMENKLRKGDVNTTVTEYAFTPAEQEVIRYAAGYIIYSLRKRYYKLSRSTKKTTKVAATATLQFLDLVKVKAHGLESKTFLDFTRKWIELRNRGGLVVINDDMYLFIRRIESCVRSILDFQFIKNYKGEDLRDVIGERILKNSTVNNYWDKLARNIENTKLKNFLKEQIISKWVDIRARSYVNAYIQIVKRIANKGQSKSVSKTAEPALRKQIH